MFYTTLRPPLPHHLFWLGLWLDSWRFYWWWTSWFISSSQARPSIRAPCQDRHAECTVTCCLWLTDWLTVLPAFSAMLLTAATTPRHEAVKQCVQFMQPLNYPCLFPSFIKTSTPFFFFLFFFYPIIRITVNCEATLHVALFYNRIL